jgi:hypothetical protein
MIRNLWPLLIGFTIWAAAFLILYILQALGCVWGWEPLWHRTILIAVTFATIGLLAGTLAVQLRRSGINSSKIEWVGKIMTAISLPTTVFIFAPVAFLSICN